MWKTHSHVVDCVPALRCTWNCLVMKNLIYMFGRTLRLMVARQNARSVLEPSMSVWALARKHPWCFHSHSRPVLLTFTSAFMWPNPKANLGTRNMFINQLLRTDAGIIIQFWSHIKNKIWQKRTFLRMFCNLNQLLYKLLFWCQYFLFSLLGNYRFLSVNSVLLNAALKYHFVKCFDLPSYLFSSSGSVTKALLSI